MDGLVGSVAQNLAVGGPLAAVLAFALKVVWGKYQAALDELKQEREERRVEVRELYDRQLAITDKVHEVVGILANAPKED